MKIQSLIIILSCYCQLALAQVSGFQYLSPKPNSVLNSRTTNIILRQGTAIDRSSVNASCLVVAGSESGIHRGTVLLADDNKTLLFTAAAAYMPNETVTVRLAPGIRTSEGGDAGAVEYSFRISPLTESASAVLAKDAARADGVDELVGQNSIAFAQTDSVPADLPKLTVGTSNNPSPGKIFLTNQGQTPGKVIGSYLMTFNNDGSPAKYMKLPKSANGFKMEPSGQLSYNLKASGARIIMDTAYTPVDTFQCGNGYNTNGHDALLLPNGHALLIGGDQQPVDMSRVVPGGNPDASVGGAVIQEVDAAHNVIFQWRSWDYLPITASYFDLTLPSIDLLRANALAIDADGSILVSLRHLSCIVKIDRNTGDILWILGGKLNQFRFVNEHDANGPTYFSYQHDIAVLPNGNITLFDNGTQHVPSYSRGVEYRLDEVTKTATMVWEYRHTPDLYANAMGSVQRLANGNTVLGWGNLTGDGVPVYTEVRADNSTALEMFFPKGQFCYRAYKYPWVSQMPEASVTAREILQGNEYSFASATDSTGIKIKFKQLAAFTYSNVIVTKYNYAPVHPAFLDDAPSLAAHYFSIQGQEVTSYTGQVRIAVAGYPAISLPRSTVVYVRAQYSDVFLPLPTTYDSVKNELLVTTSAFGEFAFGIPQSVIACAPLAISPKNEETLSAESPVTLLWGTRGVVQTYRLQVAADSTFHNLVVDAPAVATTSYTMTTVTNNARYYWRIYTTNSAGTSAWSGVSAFVTAPPFITVTYPNGRERISFDSTCVIRWQTNVHDTVSVRLMKGSVVALVIADTVVSGTNALLWQVPASMQSDSSYRIAVTSVSRAALSDASDNTFSIGRALTGVADANTTVSTYELYQNYPNPFNPSTVISYRVAAGGPVSVRLYDMMGREVSTLVDERKEAGTYTVRLDASRLTSGVYVYRLRAGAFIRAMKLTVVK